MKLHTLDDLKSLDVEAVATAIEADAGQLIPGLRQSLQDAKEGRFARVHTPEQILARRKADGSQGGLPHKKPTTLRLDEQTLARWRASGKGWQTRAAAVLAQYAPQ